jgi:hypothetical protein
MGKIINDAERSMLWSVIDDTADYQPVVPVTAHQGRMAILQNQTNQSITFSIDGGDTDCVTLATNSAIVLDLTANTGNKINDPGDFLGKNIQFAVKYTSVAPTSGSVYI